MRRDCKSAALLPRAFRAGYFFAFHYIPQYFYDFFGILTAIFSNLYHRLKKCEKKYTYFVN